MVFIGKKEREGGRKEGTKDERKKERKCPRKLLKVLKIINAQEGLRIIFLEFLYLKIFL